MPLLLPVHRATTIVHPPQVEHHRWASPEFDQPTHGLTPLDAPTIAVLRRLRSRTFPRDRWQLWMTLVLAVLLHALFVVVIWYEMSPPPPATTVVHARIDDVLQVRFIARAKPAPVEPPPAATPPALASPAAPRVRVMVKPREPLSRDVMTVQLPAPKPADSARLYGKNGQALLPAAAASAPEVGYVQNMPPSDAQVMHHADPIKYKATRFEQYFPPPGETAGGSVVRHVVEAVVNSTEVNLPNGVHLQCTTIIGVPMPSCKMPPGPPSAKDGDERLSMAPAKALAVDPHLPQPPSVEACIAIYRADKPLPWGCPNDTPERAVDDEMSKHAAGANSHP